MPHLRAGFATTTITPPLGTPLAGLFHHREARTVADDLFAKAIALGTDDQTLVMVVCDLISIPAVLSNHTRGLLAARCGLSASNIMISATHTHTGPLLNIGPDDPGWRLYQDSGTPYRNALPAANGMLTAVLDPAYCEWIGERIADVVAIALDRLEPARIAIGTTSIEGVCFNRRFHMKDGTVVFNPGILNPDIVREAGPVDPEIVTFLLERVDRRPLAMWSTLSLHYVGTDEDDAISADYYGYFGREVERVLGCPGVLANGTSGNINNVDVRNKSTITGSTKARLVAKAVAAAAMSSVISAERSDDIELRTWRHWVEIGRYQPTSHDIEIANAISAGEGRRSRTADERYSFEFGQRLPESIGFSWSSDQLRLLQLPDEASAEVQIFQVGELAIAALPGEIFVEFGLDLKRRSPFAVTAAISMSNDHLGYLPTRAAFDLGGYETWRSRSNWTAVGSGERLTDAAVVGLNELYGVAQR